MSRRRSEGRSSGSGEYQTIRPLGYKLVPHFGDVWLLTGYSELYQLPRYILDQYRGTSVLCRYAVPSKLTTEGSRKRLITTVNTAIGHVISSAPTLQAGISAENSKKPVWVALGSIDLSQHIQWKSLNTSDGIENSVQETICIELNTKFFDLALDPVRELSFCNTPTLTFLISCSYITIPTVMV